MITLSRFDYIYIFRPFVDFRKGSRGLAGIVQDEMHLNPFEKYLFLFCNRNRNRIKILYWDETGFALWYKCLEQNKYKWPVHLEEETVKVDLKKLKRFLAGLDPWQVPHQKLNYSVT